MENDSRFSPDSFTERIVRGSNKGLSKLALSAKELVDPVYTSSSPESARFKKEIDALRSNYKGSLLKTIALAPEELSLGLQKAVYGSLATAGSIVNLPFSITGERESWYNYEIKRAQEFTTKSSYASAVLSQLSETFIGYGWREDAQNGQAGLVSTIPWFFKSVKEVGKNALSLRPVKTLNSGLEAVSNLGSLGANTVKSALSTINTATFGFAKYLTRDKSQDPEKEVESTPTASPNQTTQPEPTEEDFNPGSVF